MRAIEMLKPEDYLGVQAFSENPSWIAPIRPLGDGLSLRSALDAVGSIFPHGGTQMYEALNQALLDVTSLSLPNEISKQILLLSDGISTDGTNKKFAELAQIAHNNDVTISTIALGRADQELMQLIAETSKGRYYHATIPEELPRIMTAESQAAKSENIQEGLTSVLIGEDQHPILSGLNMESVPPLNAYVSLSSKAEQGAEDVLISANFNDPLLSVWQYGLGRVVAWTGDLGEEWWQSWPSLEEEAKFWSQVVRYALPNPALQEAQVQINTTGTVTNVNMEIDDGKRPINRSNPVFSYVDLDGKTHTYPVPQVGLGRYHLRLPRLEIGAYRGILIYQDQASHSQQLAIPFAVNAPAEWVPTDPKIGMEIISTWVDASDGKLLGTDDLELNRDGTVPIQDQKVEKESDWRILFALVLLWPLEIGLRRRWMPWS